MMLGRNIKKIGNFVKIVANGAVSSPGVADGKMLPHLIIDTRDRPALEELIRVHQTLPPGDVLSVWASVLGRSDQFVLHLDFVRPTPGEFSILFNLKDHSGTIDQIISNRGVYIQAGNPGDYLSKDLGKPSLILEIPETGFDQKWDRIFFRHVKNRFKDAGLKTKRAEVAARDHIAGWRKLSSHRQQAM